MKALCLCYFDPIIGPSIVLKTPETIDDQELEILTSLMDTYEDNFFIHITGKIKSANYVFEIDNPYSRGKKELLQISVVLDLDSDIDLNLARELLNGFINEFNVIEDVYKAFYIDFEGTKEGSHKLKEIKELFNSLYKSFEPAVRALKIAELRYQTLFQSARDAILITEKKTAKILDANIMAEKLFETPRENIIGLNALSFSFEEDIENIRKKILELIRTDDATPIEIRIKKSDGSELPVELNASEIKINDRELILFIIRDITERKIAEQKLVKAYDRTEFYKDFFAYDMNHILSNINRSIDSLSLFFKDPNIKGDQDELLTRIKEQALRGLNLILYIQRILDIEGSEIYMGKVEINRVLKEAITFVSNNFFERLLKIEVSTIGDVLYVRANELLLNVFESILLNGAQHNDKPIVHIHVNISREKINRSNYLRIEFLDNGKGIPEETKQFLFIKGFRPEQSLSGMGLGLYLVKKIIESSGGKIWVENRIPNDYKKGSNFILLLPEASS